jgi:hypothetical protein
VQAVRVVRPPLTFLVSSRSNSRAPRRTNTLLWSFILVLLVRHFGSIERAQALQKQFFVAVHLEGDEVKLALTDKRVSVRYTPFGVPCADGIGWETATDALHLLSAQFTSAPAGQDSVVLIHISLLLRSSLPLSGQVFQKSFGPPPGGKSHRAAGCDSIWAAARRHRQDVRLALQPRPTDKMCLRLSRLSAGV